MIAVLLGAILGFTGIVIVLMVLGTVISIWPLLVVLVLWGIVHDLTKAHRRRW